MGWVWCSCVYVSSLSYLPVTCGRICTVLSVEVDWDTCLLPVFRALVSRLDGSIEDTIGPAALIREVVLFQR